MSQQPDPARASNIDEWWRNIDLRAPLETDLALDAFHERVSNRRDVTIIPPQQTTPTERSDFISRLDEFLGAVRGHPSNQATDYVGRFVSEIRFCSREDSQVERRGLLELRDSRGRNLLLAGERLRPVGEGFAGYDVAFIEHEAAPRFTLLLSPLAFASELNKVGRALRSPIGHEFLERGSGLYCLIRESIGQRFGADVGWDQRVKYITPTWAGESTSFVYHFENGRRFDALLDYVPDLCELGFKIREV
jgi:hypothetical protein